MLAEVPGSVRVGIERPSREQVRAAALPVAGLHEASGRRGALPSVIKPVDPAMRLCGPAVTVSCPPGDNLRLHHAMYLAEPGDVLVAYVGDAYEHGYWGEVMTVAAMARGLGGLVIDGGVRDRDQLVELGFPVFSRGICVQGTGKDPGAAGSINHPIVIGGAVIEPGDVVVGDADGVVVVQRACLEEVVRETLARIDGEAEQIAALRGGARTIDQYGYDIHELSAQVPSMAKRRSIDVEGLGHGAMPIPYASRKGPLLVSGGILGTDPATGQLPADDEEQVARLFGNVTRLMEAAGGATGDIVKMTFFVRDRSLRDAINEHWVEMFPDPASRPARHTLIATLSDPVQVQCEVIAFLDGGRP